MAELLGNQDRVDASGVHPSPEGVPTVVRNDLDTSECRSSLESVSKFRLCPRLTVRGKQAKSILMCLREARKNAHRST